MHLELEDHLKKWFGYNSFRIHQKEIIEGVLQKNDVMAILPTGAGKSICYQLPALILEGTAIVVSPLISLMQDQVSALSKVEIPAAFINSSLGLSDLHHILSHLNDYKLLYIAPERLSDINFLERLKGLNISFFVIDEAHCISQWGHSFRPDYRALGMIKEHFSDKPLMALTATATIDVEKDIMDQLKMKKPIIIKGSFDRTNLMIRVQEKNDPDSQMHRFLRSRKDQTGIIYVATRKNVDLVYELVKNSGFNVGKYHAGLSDKDRTQSLHDFIHDKINLMVATVAFGMGINKPDVRFIIHYDMPKNIEQYYQEIGRAGRDGLPSDCLMLYSAKELMVYKSFLKNIEDEFIKKQTENRTKELYYFCRSPKCRRIGLLSYFGERYFSRSCNSCDNCIGDKELIDGTVIAQKILSCVYRLNFKFGVRYVMDVLRGIDHPQIIENGHDKVSTYGLMKEFKEQELRYYIDNLINMQLLTTSDGDFPVLEWTEKSSVAIKGLEKIFFAKIVFKEKETVREAVTDLKYDKELFEKLKALRFVLSKEEELPAFAIFSDRSLYEMATYYPKTEKQMLNINGVGRFKLDKYAKRFMELISSYGVDEKVVTQEEKGSSKKSKIDRKDSAKISFDLFLQHKTFDEIAKVRNLVASTVQAHICEYIESLEHDDSINVEWYVTKPRQQMINEVIDIVGLEKLTPIKEKLPQDYRYEEIGLVRSLRRLQMKNK